MGKQLEDLGERSRFLRILWTDNANMIRSKALRLKVDDDVSEAVVGISRAQQGVPVVYDGVVPGAPLDPVGEVYLRADKSTTRKLPYAPGNSLAIGDMYVDGSPWEFCPRNYLKKMLKLAVEDGLEIKASFENEFYLLNKDDPLKCQENTAFASTNSMNLNNNVIMEIADDLEAQGLSVEQYYPESGPCQHELTVHYDDAMKAADNQIIFRETVRAVALKHEKVASFLPKLFADHAGSGCHIHLSLWRDGVNILHDPDEKFELGSTAHHFIAGILEHLSSLMAITTPTPNSYRRILPSSWAGKYGCWGFDNREASIRVVKEPDGTIKHFEIKTSDATSNPYLSLGSIICAGLNGIHEKLSLPEPVQLDPAKLDDKERSKLKIKDLPSCVDDAIKSLFNNEVLINSLGDGLSKAYIAVKTEENNYLKNLSLEEEVKLLLDKY
jgi:glutamine synthetase